MFASREQTDLRNPLVSEATVSRPRLVSQAPILLALLLAPASISASALEVQRQVLSLNSGVEPQWESSEGVLSRPAGLKVREVTLEEALLRLGRSADIRIGYSPSQLPETKRVTCLCEEATVGQAVHTILAGTDLEISVVEDYLVIRQGRVPESVRNLSAGRIDEPMPLRVMGSLELPVIPIQELGVIFGRVVDVGTQQPLAVAQISVTGRQGFLTSSDGSFRISGVPAGTYTVTAELIG
jgi:hypothetical protein